MAAATTSTRSWGDNRSKPTQAKPKHTLPGSTMEMLSDQDRQHLKKLDLAEYQRRVQEQRQMVQDRYKLPKVPHYMRKQVQAQTKHGVIKQLEETNQARFLMDALEEKSRYFEVGLNENNGNASQSNTQRAKSDQWMGENDLEHSNDINIIGIGNSKSYNHQKYNSAAPMQKYSNAGDLLRLGKGCSAPKTVPEHRRPYWLAQTHVPVGRIPREAYMREDELDPNDFCAVTLPANIKHQFGSKVCNRLLSDVTKVEDTIVQQKVKRRPRREKARSSTDSKGTADKEDMDPAYQSLGDALRYDIFPGYSQNYKKSLAKTTYTEDVHKKRYQDPDQYRYQRDQLSVWAEHNVLRERMKKAWDNRLAENTS